MSSSPAATAASAVDEGLPDERPLLAPWLRRAEADGRIVLEYGDEIVVLGGVRPAPSSTACSRSWTDRGPRRRSPGVAHSARRSRGIARRAPRARPRRRRTARRRGGDAVRGAGARNRPGRGRATTLGGHRRDRRRVALRGRARPAARADRRCGRSRDVGRPCRRRRRDRRAVACRAPASRTLERPDARARDAVAPGAPFQRAARRARSAVHPRRHVLSRVFPASPGREPRRARACCRARLRAGAVPGACAAVDRPRRARGRTARPVARDPGSRRARNAVRPRARSRIRVDAHRVLRVPRCPACSETHRYAAPLPWGIV